MNNRKIQLSVLDQTPIRYNSNASEALQESIQLAKRADELGYTRYWLSEHHNTKTLAQGAPEVFIARLANETKRIKVGSGGVMLPNHSTLKVAENFRLLEALYPHRIDLGIGRAPGGDRITAQLLNPSNTFDPQEYIYQLSDLQNYLTDTPAPGNLQGKIRAIPIINSVPDLWILTSSGESAYLAAYFGMAVSYAKFINPLGGEEAIKHYKANFKASQLLSEPTTSVGIFAFCSEDEEKLKQMQALMDYRLIGFEKGLHDELFCYNDIKNYEYTEAEWKRVLYNRQRYIIGTPEEIKQQFTALAQSMDTTEIIVATFAEQFEDRLHSYELIAKAFELK